MTSGDWLPTAAPFDLVRRGYSPEQVTAHLERLEYDLRIATANRDATAQRLSELTAQLTAAQGESDSLRHQLDRSALEPVSMSGLSDRMQRMIRLAEEEAGDIRSRAEADAVRLRQQLQTALAEAAENRSAFDTERERTRQQLAEQVHNLITEATGEAEETRTQAQDEATRVLQEATAEADRTSHEARAFAERTTAAATGAAESAVAAATAQAEQLRTDAARDAAETTSSAQARADETTAAAAAQRERLDAESAARRAQVEQDFDIAFTARRAESAKTIADRETGSIADADARVATASAHAQKTVDDAQAEADLLMQRATTYANALVNRAAAESRQRVVDADHAVETLLELRTQLRDQLRSLAGHLDHIRELAGSAPDLLTTPMRESGRPRSDQFPADPAARPTDVGHPVPVLETGPADPDAAGRPVAAGPAIPDFDAEAATGDAQPSAEGSGAAEPADQSGGTDEVLPESGPDEPELATVPATDGPATHGSSPVDTHPGDLGRLRQRTFGGRPRR